MRNLIAFIAFGMAVSASASLMPVSYDMNNGHGQASGGSYNYWDQSYSGSGSTTTDNDWLSGGLGDLTDGVVATDNWYNVENGAGTGPYVGWRQGVLPNGPVITFHMGSLSQINSLTVYADDSDGAGGVSLPDYVIINGTSYDVDQNAAGAEPKALTFTGLNFMASDFDVQFGYSNEWVFVSEIEVNAVPEPMSMAVLGLGAVALLCRRRSK